MVLSWKSRTLALVVTLAAAVAVAMSVGGRGCDQARSSPVETARGFVEAAELGDRQAMYELLSTPTKDALIRGAAALTDLGSRRVEPPELISVGNQLVDLAAEGPGRSPTYDLLRESGESATVRIVDRRGRAHELSMLLEDGRWRVHNAAFAAAPPSPSLTAEPAPSPAAPGALDAGTIQGHGGGGDTPVARVSVARPTITGAFDNGIVWRMVRQRSAMLGKCYATELAANAAIAGQVTATFTVGAGKATDIDTDGVGALRFHKCVRATVGDIEFPPARDGKSSRVTIDLEFAKREPVRR